MPALSQVRSSILNYADVSAWEMMKFVEIKVQTLSGINSFAAVSVFHRSALMTTSSMTPLVNVYVPL